MTRRERITAIIARKPVDRSGFWLGNPDLATWPILHRHFGTTGIEELRVKLGDDLRWITPQFSHSYSMVEGGCYKHPDGRGLFAVPGKSGGHGVAGPFADCESVAEVEDYPWPSVEHCDFSAALAVLRSSGDVYRASSMWCSFFHNVMDLFGFESYLMKMHTHPEVVEAVTRHVCEFYLAANERWLTLAGDEADAVFFGNDFGTQCDLFMSPKSFDRFVLPWFVRFTDQGHAHGKQVILHSCGAISRVIDRLIDAGVDCLHPLQARATGMGAADLAPRFKGRIAFLGGIDAQGLMVNGTPQQIRDEVRRVRDLLGPHVIISPSHEAILPDVPPANVEALAAAAGEA